MYVSLKIGLKSHGSRVEHHAAEKSSLFLPFHPNLAHFGIEICSGAMRSGRQMTPSQRCLEEEKRSIVAASRTENRPSNAAERVRFSLPKGSLFSVVFGARIGTCGEKSSNAYCAVAPIAMEGLGKGTCRSLQMRQRLHVCVNDSFIPHLYAIRDREWFDRYEGLQFRADECRRKSFSLVESIFTHFSKYIE